MNEILEQLKQYCTCNEEITLEDLTEAINVISIMTCWKIDDECSTLLNEEREEIIELEDCTKVYKFFPHYIPFDNDTLKLEILKETDEGIVHEDIPSESFEYIPELGYVLVTLPECQCGNKCCGKVKKYLKATYDAGFKTLPDCILPVMCNILELIQDKRVCDCNCDNCNSNKTTNPMDSINYKQSDYITSYLEYKVLAEKLGQAYYSALAQISLCEKDNDKWCVVC